MYQVITIDPQRRLLGEQLGTKRKYWYVDGERRMLFKAEERGTGEDWAEKIACELCGLLGLPHVRYELAKEEGTETPGVVCETCAPPPSALVLGNQLLLAIDPAYPDERVPRYKVTAHTIDAVVNALQLGGLLQPPPAPWRDGMPGGIVSALDVFAGYVMLDAWIANQDRHHENWGVLLVDRVLYLAPTFDHGASLARNLADEERQNRLTTRDQGRTVARFSRRARSAFFQDVAAMRPLTTIEAWRAFAGRSPAAETAWLARLDGIGDDTIRRVVEEVPPARMSQVCRDFTTALLIENKRRILANDEE